MPKNDSAFTTKTVNQLRVLSTTASSSSTTGSLIVDGGMGIAGNVNIAGTLTAGSITYASTSTGTLDVTDGTGTTFTVDSTEECVGVSTGCATFAGGVYVAKNVYISGTLTAGSITYASTSTGTLNITDGSGTTLTVDSTTDSTSTTTGSGKFFGGIGVAKAIYCANLHTTDTTQSTTTTTGSIVTAGGIGAAGNITAGGTLTAGNVTASGTVNNGGFDFVMGNADSATRGDTGQSRALVKTSGGVLNLNYLGDFFGGTILGGPSVGVSGTLSVTGNTTLSTATVSGTTTLGTVNGGAASFTTNTVSGQSTLAAVSASGNSVLNAVTANGALIANSSSTLNGATAINSNVTVTPSSGTAVTIAGVSAQNALQVTVAATPVMTVSATNTTIPNIAATTINVTGTYSSNSTPVIVNSSGDVNITSTNLTTTGLTSSIATASTSIDTPILKINGINRVYASGGNVHIGQNTEQVNLPGTLYVGGFDMVLGKGDQSTRGDSGESRALVKEAGAVLHLNYLGDFTGGVSVGSKIEIKGYDLVLGSGNNVDRGDSGASRAMVKDLELGLTPTEAALYLNYEGDFQGGVVIDSKATVKEKLDVLGFDLTLGSGDQSTRGDSGQSRALVKGVDNRLVLNFESDYTGGVEVQSYANVTGDLRANNFKELTVTSVSMVHTRPELVTATLFTNVTAQQVGMMVFVYYNVSFTSFEGGEFDFIGTEVHFTLDNVDLPQGADWYCDYVRVAANPISFWGNSIIYNTDNTYQILFTTNGVTGTQRPFPNQFIVASDGATYTYRGCITGLVA